MHNANSVTQAAKTTEMAEVLAQIARKVLKMETLEARNADSLDFQEHAVWKIREALEAAYQAGAASAKR